MIVTFHHAHTRVGSKLFMAGLGKTPPRTEKCRFLLEKVATIFSFSIAAF